MGPCDVMYLRILELTKPFYTYPFGTKHRSGKTAQRLLSVREWHSRRGFFSTSINRRQLRSGGSSKYASQKQIVINMQLLRINVIVDRTIRKRECMDPSVVICNLPLM